MTDIKITPVHSRIYYLSEGSSLAVAQNLIAVAAIKWALSRRSPEDVITAIPMALSGDDRLVKPQEGNFDDFTAEDNLVLYFIGATPSQEVLEDIAIRARRVTVQLSDPSLCNGLTTGFHKANEEVKILYQVATDVSTSLTGIITALDMLVHQIALFDDKDEEAAKAYAIRCFGSNYEGAEKLKEAFSAYTTPKKISYHELEDWLRLTRMAQVINDPALIHSKADAMKNPNELLKTAIMFNCSKYGQLKTIDHLINYGGHLPIVL